MLFLYIAAGGAAGALARHGLVAWVNGWAGSWMAWGTLTVNVSGSFLIGLLMGYVETAPLSPALRTLLAVGLLGSFTTFSTFAFEAVTLFRDGHATRAALYVFGSLALGVLAVLGGMMLTISAAAR